MSDEELDEHLFATVRRWGSPTVEFHTGYDAAEEYARKRIEADIPVEEFDIYHVGTPVAKISSE